MKTGGDTLGRAPLTCASQKHTWVVKSEGCSHAEGPPGSEDDLQIQRGGGGRTPPQYKF